MKALPKDLTSYDFLKAVAVIIMITDHAGYYFFPEEPLFRAVGRIGFPVWFFLVGHASGRNIPLKLSGGAFLLLVANYVTGITIFPLNALFTIIGIRLLLDKMAALAFKNIEALICALSILTALVLPTFFITEYGTQALITALFGYAVRQRVNVGKLDEKAIRVITGAVTFISFVVIQQMWFQFTPLPLTIMVLGTLAFVVTLYNFKAETYPNVTRVCYGPLCWVIQIMGRRTLEIYVIHLVLFKFAALAMGAEGYEFMAFHLFPVI